MDNYRITEMKNSDNYYDYLIQFSKFRNIKDFLLGNIIDEEAIKRSKAELDRYLSNDSFVLEQNSHLFRARIAFTEEEKYQLWFEENEIYAGFDKNGSLFSPQKRSNGRVDGPNIHVLYTSFTKETAIAEVRPIRDDLVSVA